MRRSTSTLSRLYDGVAVLLRSESGIAMPTVLVSTLVALGLGSAAAVASIAAQGGSVRDQDTKTAIGAAEAGAERAVYRYNKVATTPSLPCLVSGGGGIYSPGVRLGDGWCPAVTGTIGNASYSYRVKPIVSGAAVDSIEIVSTGTSDGVSRRIDITARTGSGAVFGNFAVIGDQSVTLDSNATVSSSTASNGDIMLTGSAQICGNIQYGVGHQVSFNNSSTQCNGYSQGSGIVNLPPVNQGDVVTNNSNGRFFGLDPRSSTRVTWDSPTRTLTVGTNSSLTLGGGNYSFCKLIMRSNSTIYIAAGANVKIYFDSPEACGQPSGTLQMDASSNSNVLTTGSSPASAAFLFVGSDTRATRAILSSNSSVGCSFEILVYGPRTDITLASNTNICGGVAGKTIYMESQSHLSPHPDAQNFTLPLPTHYTPSRYVECGPAGTAPNSNC